MAKKFTLTAQLVLQAPNQSQISGIVNTINRGLRGISANINININQATQRQINAINNTLNKTRKTVDDTSSAVERFGKSSALAIKRFAAFSIATSGIIGLGAAMKNSFAEAVKFDREMIRIAQVTGKPLSALKELSDEIGRLSKTFGVNSDKVAKVAVTLSQAGISARDTKDALEILAKTELSATFEDINDTAEGAIAILAQFGGSVRDLERDLGAINAVSAKFAVESSDLITTIRRTGGAFKAAGGNLNELIALFTSVRATTRESAETIATGFRTIFTRIQRPKTVEFLKNLGVELRDLKGNFVGPYEAISRLSDALKGIESTDPRFSQIVEELGGFRQVSKVIPLLQQFEISQKALGVAQKANNSISEDAEIAQQALSTQVNKLKESFNDLFRTIANDSGIRSFISLTLNLANSLIKVADSLTPILPLIVGFGAVKGAQFLGGASSSFLKTIKQKNKGGPIGYAGGGFVPGSGNRDTVPAMLTPGEFVLRKSAVNAIGASNVAKFNKYADGGEVTFGMAGLLGKPSDKTYPIKVGQDTYTAHIIAAVISKLKGEQLEKQTVRPAIFGAAISSAQELGKTIGAKPQLGDIKRSMRKLDLNSVSGLVFEAALGSLGAPYDDSAEIRDRFDFPKGIGKLSSLFGNDRLGFDIPVDAKRNIDNDAILKFKDKKVSKYLASLSAFSGPIGETLSTKDIAKKLSGIGAIGKDATTSNIHRVFAQETKQLPFGFLAGDKGTFTRTGQRRAGGGGISGSDTVPALLTPGEFVVNKESARRIGHNNLKRINRFAKGGSVGDVITNHPIAATFAASQIAGSISNLAGFGTEISKVTGLVSSVAIQFAVLNSAIKSNPLGRILDFTKEIKDTTGSLRKLRQESVAIDRKRAKTQNALNPLQALQSQGGLLTAPQAAKQSRLQTFLSGLDSRSLEIEQQRGALSSKRLRSAQLQKFGRGLSVGGAVFGAVGGIGGEALKDFGTSQIAATGGKSGRVTSGIGGALSGAASGAAIGALIAPILGPLAPLGPIAGAAVGGIKGFVDSLREADTQIAQIDFNNTLSNINDTFKQLSFGNINEKQASGKLESSLDTLLKQRVELTNANREGFLGIGGVDNSAAIKSNAADIENILPQIIDFVGKQASGSNSSKEFNSKVGNLPNLIASFGGPLVDTWKKQIAQNAKLNAIHQESIRLRELENKRMQALINISNTIDDFGTELSIVNAQLDVTGNSFVKVSDILGRIGANKDTTRFNNAAASVGSFIGGKTGQSITNKLSAANVIGLSLPKIISDAAKKDLGSRSGSLADTVRDDVKELVNRLLPNASDAGDRKDILDAISNSILLQLPSEKDTKKVEEIGTNATKVAGDIFEPLKDNLTNVASKLADAVQSQSDKIRDAFKKRLELEDNLAEGLRKIADIQENITRTKAGFADRDITASEVGGFAAARRAPLLANAGVGDLGGAISKSQALVARKNLLQQQSNSGILTSVQTAKELADLDNQLQHVNKVLHDYADSTQRVSDLQAVLAKETENRKKKQGVIEGIAFGGAGERSENLKTLLLSAKAAKTGTLQGIDPANQQKILSFLDNLGTANVFGKGPANDIAKQLRRDFFGPGKGFVDAGQGEKTIQEQIITEQKNAIIAQEALNVQTLTLSNVNERLITSIDNLATLMQGRIGGIGRARGGIIPGSGNGDSVPAMLTPGEFVIRKDAARAIGYDNLAEMNAYASGGRVVNQFATVSRLEQRVARGERRYREKRFEENVINNPNSRRNILAARREAYKQNKAAKRQRRQFAAGGLVSDGGNGGTSDGFNTAVTMFANSAASLSNALNAFPRSIEMSAKHTVEVIFNGAEILTRLLPTIQEVAVSEAENAINKMIKTKIPDVGIM